MKIAITGGAGFIGSHLARAYLDSGHDVLVIDALISGSARAVDPRARFYRVDIRDRQLQRILEQERPDLVSHHAAPRECEMPGEPPLTDADINVRGLLNVLDSCVNACIGKIIFASGGNSMYGSMACQHLPAGEDTPLHPQRPLDITKAAGEWYVRYYTRQYGLEHTILRYADVYGETDRDLAQHPLTYFVYTLLERDCCPVIRALPHELRDTIFIDDVVRANLYALERGKNQTLHISSGQGYALEQFYFAVAHLLGSEIQPAHINNRLVEAASIVLDNTLAQRVLGWRPEVDLATGVERTVSAICEMTGQRCAPVHIVHTPPQKIKAASPAAALA
ncbi:MAG: NAD-dependent epimerase/dehydratase family protein [Chloroflexota bacterium]|nr:NAD-dependent epimerase/dehydratase family protein [Chloroflexota bacterium]